MAPALPATVVHGVGGVWQLTSSLLLLRGGWGKKKSCFGVWPNSLICTLNDVSSVGSVTLQAGRTGGVTTHNCTHPHPPLTLDSLLQVYFALISQIVENCKTKEGKRVVQESLVRMSYDRGSCYGARLNGDAVEQSHDLTPLLRGCSTTFPFNLAHTVCIGKANLNTVTTHMHTSQSSPSPSSHHCLP